MNGFAKVQHDGFGGVVLVIGFRIAYGVNQDDFWRAFAEYVV
jgi:hypothetical protein